MIIDYIYLDVFLDNPAKILYKRLGYKTYETTKVYYGTEGGGKVYPFYPKRHFKDRHAYSPFVVRKYCDRKLRLTESKSVEYEILPENIGYAFISNFKENYLTNEFPEVL